MINKIQTNIRKTSIPEQEPLCGVALTLLKNVGVIFVQVWAFIDEGLAAFRMSSEKPLQQDCGTLGKSL